METQLSEQSDSLNFRSDWKLIIRLRILRPPLNDVTSASVNTSNDSGGDLKRQKVTNGSGIGGGGGGGGAGHV